MNKELEKPEALVQFPEDHIETFREAFSKNGVFICGGVGSGKTSGSGIPLKESKPDVTATEDTEHE